MTPTLSLCSFALWALAPLTLPADALADVPVALPTPAPETEQVRLAWDAAGDESQLRDGLSGSASLGVSIHLCAGGTGAVDDLDPLAFGDRALSDLDREELGCGEERIEGDSLGFCTHSCVPRSVFPGSLGVVPVPEGGDLQEDEAPRRDTERAGFVDHAEASAAAGPEDGLAHFVSRGCREALVALHLPGFLDPGATAAVGCVTGRVEVEPQGLGDVGVGVGRERSPVGKPIERGIRSPGCARVVGVVRAGADEPEYEREAQASSRDFPEGPAAADAGKGSAPSNSLPDALQVSFSPLATGRSICS